MTSKESVIHIFLVHDFEINRCVSAAVQLSNFLTLFMKAIKTSSRSDDSTNDVSPFLQQYLVVILLFHSSITKFSSKNFLYFLEARNHANELLKRLQLFPELKKYCLCFPEIVTLFLEMESQILH